MTRTVLVVEDAPEIALALRIMLQKAGYEVSVVGDGLEAVERFAREQPDLVLLDIGLPGIDGIEVLRRLRETSTTPVVMLTALAREADVARCLELGASAYLTKPLGVTEVVEHVQRLLAADPS